MNALVVGGSNGIGLSIVINLLNDSNVNNVIVIDRNLFPEKYKCDKIEFIQYDLLEFKDSTELKISQDIDALYITAGFGHLDYFQNFTDSYVNNIFQVNTISLILFIKKFYQKLLNKEDFYCCVMVSIAGRLNSPMFSLYSASKAALSKFIEAINVELEVQGSKNRVLEVSPGSLKGTSFNGAISDPMLTIDLASEIIDKTIQREILFIPEYDSVFKNVIDRYHADAHKFGVDSYWYKQDRIESNK